MSKHKDRKRVEKQAPVQGSPRQEVERLIRKGWFKDAVKQAKLCYRDESTPENHRLLERAYFLRAQQLHREAMPSSAAEVAQHLLEFGVTDPELPAELVPLLLALGLSKAALALGERLESPEDRARLILTAADQAVLDPKRAPTAMPEIVEGSALIRAALEAVEADDEAGALDRLRPIARNSPFADWRYFVRGLAAWRRRDDEQVAANWGRLDANRVAARIAQSLGSLVKKTMAPSLPATATFTSTTAAPTPVTGTVTVKPTTTASNLKAIESAVFGEPLISQLEQLQQSLIEHRWGDAIPLLVPIRFSLRRVDPRLAERLTEILVWPLAEQIAKQTPREARQLVGAFVKAAEPLPIDPRWNRLRAILAEGPQDDYDESEKFWMAYIEDLKTTLTIPFSPEERQRAQALVWEHVAQQYAEDADPDWDEDNPFAEPPDPEDLQYAKKRTIECLEASLQADPTFVAGYEALFHSYDNWNQEDRARIVANRLLEVDPNHFETLLWLIEYHVALDQHDKAMPLIQRARALKPLDEGLRQTEWSAHAARARHYALNKRWDEGRAEFALAESVAPEESKSYIHAARRAVFELKAGQADRANELIEAAQGQLVEPTPLWLAILIEGARYRLPKAALQRFPPLWEAGLAQKGKSETAGAMAKLLSIYLAADVKYTGRSTQVQQVTAYLKRASRITYREDDLLAVIAFLNFKSVKAKTLLDQLIRRGMKNFPKNARFPFLVAGLEIEKGPRRGNLYLIRSHLEKSMLLAQGSNNPIEIKLIPEIKKLLAKFEPLTQSPFGMPFPGFGGMPFPGFGGRPPHPFFDIDLGFPFDMFDDEDDAPRPGRPANPSRSTPKKKTPKTPKKKG